QCRGVDVLVAAKTREAVGKHDDYRTHPAIVHESRSSFGDVLAERLPVEVSRAGPGEADQVVQHGKASSGAAMAVVLGRQPDSDRTNVRIAQWIVREKSGHVLQSDNRTGAPHAMFDGHRKRITGAQRRGAPGSRNSRAASAYSWSTNTTGA